MSLKLYLISFLIIFDPTLLPSLGKSGFTTGTGHQFLTGPPLTPCTHSHSSVPNSAHVDVFGPWEEVEREIQREDANYTAFANLCSTVSPFETSLGVTTSHNLL